MSEIFSFSFLVHLASLKMSMQFIYSDDFEKSFEYKLMDFLTTNRVGRPIWKVLKPLLKEALYESYILEMQSSDSDLSSSGYDRKTFEHEFMIMTIREKRLDFLLLLAFSDYSPCERNGDICPVADEVAVRAIGLFQLMGDRSGAFIPYQEITPFQEHVLKSISDVRTFFSSMTEQIQAFSQTCNFAYFRDAEQNVAGVEVNPQFLNTDSYFLERVTLVSTLPDVTDLPVTYLIRSKAGSQFREGELLTLQCNDGHSRQFSVVSGDSMRNMVASSWVVASLLEDLMLDIRDYRDFGLDLNAGDRSLAEGLARDRYLSYTPVENQEQILMDIFVGQSIAGSGFYPV